MRGRAVIYVTAGAAFALAVLLSILGVGEKEGALTNWQALVLGIVQGATELLPISSSGHLILVPWLADWQVLQEDDEFNQTFDVALHLGTLVAVVGYFWRDVVRLLSSWFGSLLRRSITSTDERVAWAVFVATIPAAVAGALGEEFIVDRLGEPWQIAILLAFFALILLVADRTPQRRDLETVGVKEGFAIGVAQGLALAPGVSRSGITISAARFLGFDRDSAARLSFLLLIPTTFGAVLWKGITDVLLADLPAGWQGPFVVGILAALASGLLAIVFLLGFVRRHTYAPFVVYRVVVAISQATERIRLGTSVTCPTIRIHPAIIAHASATAGSMMEGRFFLGLGTGENLNEHIVGEGWPAPDEPPDIALAAAKPLAAELAGRAADAFINTSPDSEPIEQFESAGGKGKPKYGQITGCWAASEDEGAKIACEVWPNAALGGDLTYELPLPLHFEQATEDVKPEDLAEAIPCGPDADRWLEDIRAYEQAGYTHIYFHQIGRDQEGFLRFWSEELQPKL